jgi:hypothetical protein
MVFKNVSVELDGINNGIIVEQRCSNGKKKIISDKAGGPRLFKNLDVAMTNAHYLLDKENGDIDFLFKLGSKKFRVADSQIIKDICQLYDSENAIKYNIKEDNMQKVVKLGYIVTEKGDTVRCDKQYGVKQVKKLLEYARDIGFGILCENMDISFTRIERGNYRYTFSIKNSTGKINIVTNSKLMDINQDRKQVDIRCLPYLKEMDKFTTLYIYATKDPAETPKANTDEAINKLIEYIVNDFNYYYFNNEDDDEVFFKEVEFNGYISIGKED